MGHDNHPQRSMATNTTKGAQPNELTADREEQFPQRRIAGRERRKRFRVKKLYLLALLMLLLGTSCSVLSVFKYQFYSVRLRESYDLVQQAMQHVQTAKSLLTLYENNLLDARSVHQAHFEFTAALRDFTSLNSDLKSIPGAINDLPGYGAKLRVGLDLAPIAIEVSQAGVEACDALNLILSSIHNPFAVTQQMSNSPGQQSGITRADMANISANFRQLRSLAYVVAGQIDHVSPGDLQVDPHLEKFFGTVRSALPALLSGLDLAQSFLAIAPNLLGVGTSTSYLIEVLDSTELRPGGGFIGNIGIARLQNAQLTSVEVTDVDLLDRPFEAAGNALPYPPAYQWFDLAPQSWSLRDSNLDADFPTAARYAETIYKREGGHVDVQGVVAITPAFIEHILAITGPIFMPEYHDIVTAQNVVERIHYHQLVASEGLDTVPSTDGRSSQRKHFTALLAEHLTSRVSQIVSKALPRFLHLFVSSLRSKDIQIYLNSRMAEQYLQRYHLDAAIQSPTMGDSLFVVDANISPNKANDFIINTLDDSVNLDAQGNALHHMTIRYAWIVNGNVYGASLYRDYVRVYLPAGSTLHTQDGWLPKGTGNAFGRAVVAGMFTLAFGQTRTITLVWTTPNAAMKVSRGLRYQYLIQRQAGTLWTLHLLVTLPTCAHSTHTWVGLLPSTAYSGALTHPLNEDLNEGVTYVC